MTYGAKERTASPRTVLFLCTGNSARSILAEAIMNRVGAPSFQAFSAGSHPKGEVNPHAISLLRELGFETDGLSSKSWNVFAAPDAPKLDVIITVCDNAAAEACPAWPGRPATAHWSIPDPAAASGPDAARAFADVYPLLQDRIVSFCADPPAAPEPPPDTTAKAARR